jgi:hypothetical protein
MAQTIRTSDARDTASNIGMVLLLLVMLALFAVLVWSLQQQSPNFADQQQFSGPSASPGGGPGRAEDR